ncbi:MAG: hypothetical protein WBG57_06400 [Ornithinimicrobium sp.]
MRSPRLSITGGAIAALTVGVLRSASPAAAAPPSQITEPVNFTDTDDDLCGSGLSVAIAGDGERSVQLGERRGQTYELVRFRLETTFTNTETGASFTIRDVGRGKDLQVTDNGDGTVTEVFFETGLQVAYDSDGRIIGKNAGQIRFLTTIDLNGTPEDPGDDTVIAQEVILGSTGTNDDFCDFAVPALSQ